MKKHSLVSPLCIGVCAMVCVAVSADPTVDWNTVDSGGGVSSGGPFTVSGTVGQGDAGSMTGGPFELTGGFWLGGAAADCDQNGIVDLADGAAFNDCLLGPGKGLGVGCACFDFDRDGEVTLLDYSGFQRQFGQ